jgi:hypothetical protein
MKELFYEPVVEKPNNTQIKFNRLARPLVTASYSTLDQEEMSLNRRQDPFISIINKRCDISSEGYAAHPVMQVQQPTADYNGRLALFKI